MTIADLVAAPDFRQESFGDLVHVEYQLRVLGLVCAAASEKPRKFSTPGSLEAWAEYGKKQSENLNCSDCRTDAVEVADSISTVVVEESGLSIRQVRNRICHGGPVPEAVNRALLRRVVSENAERIVRIYEHGHVAMLAPYFCTIDGSLTALHSFSGTAATYWPRRGEAVDIADPHVVDALNKLKFQFGDRLLDDFAQDIARDLRGFAERDSIYVMVSPNEPIAVRWDRRTSDGVEERVDRFMLGVDLARKWVTESGPNPYKAFLADVCHWPLLKRRLLEDLEDQDAAEKRISRELFPNLPQLVAPVPTHVQFDDDYQGPRVNLTISEACDEVTEGIHSYRGSTNLITLTGEAGAGKTYSLLQFARESLHSNDDLSPLVIYISSSKSSATTLDKLITARVAGTRIVDREGVLALCRAGLAILVIDGFDEMLGFRSYDDPLRGLQPILDELRNRGAVILSARASYAEARLWKSLKEHPTRDTRHRLTTMKLQPWRRDQLLKLTEHLSIDVSTEEAPEVRQLLTTPFFCLAYAAWKQAGSSGDFLRFVVDAYLQRELDKLEIHQGGTLFTKEDLSMIFCEVADMAARNVAAEVTRSELMDAAAYALGKELDEKERRRLESLCAMSAEWSEHELSFGFTHLAIAEHFLARQVVRQSPRLALALLSDVAVSALCAQLITSMWPEGQHETLVALISTLQARVSAAASTDDCLPAMASLGELWAKVHGTAGEARRVSRIIVERLELHGCGTVTLDQAQVQYLEVGPDIKVQLTNSQVDLMALSQKPGNPLLGDSYKQVGELLTQGGLASTPKGIRELLGLSDENADESSIEVFFRDKIANVRAAIVVDRNFNAPDEDVRMKWTREHGDAWQSFAKRMVAEGKLIREPVTSAGPVKWRLRPTEAFYDD
ncbi:NACHT domain-containing protein [Streptomyces rubiginosohelvolus]|uniref:NACHT domain-containing protein n=1 Tax=Streptomyces rubiginosohelvolus TaxID=67362 RepID=UPI00364BAC44